MPNIDFNRHTIPPGGWQFYQPQTGWKAPTPIGSTFDQTVDLIVKHRLMNQAIVLKYKLATDWNTVAMELEQFTKKRLGIPAEALPNPKTLARPAAPSAVAAAAGVVARKEPSVLGRFANVASALKKVSVGVGTVLDCVGSEPVARELAESRAKVCVGCAMNGKGDFTSWFTVPLSEAIRKAETALRERNLATSLDDKLGVCASCLCPLKLKTWCSIRAIKDHLIAEVQADLPPHCWILTEK